MRKVFLTTVIGFLMWMLVSGLIICIIPEPEPVLNMAPIGALKVDPVKYDYRVIECNVVGSSDVDYVIEVVTRDPEEVERICLRLGGVGK